MDQEVGGGQELLPLFDICEIFSGFSEIALSCSKVFALK